MDNVSALKSMGFVLPTPAYIFGAILFGVLGFAAYRYGKRSGCAASRWIGLALMFYPYLVSGTLMLYVVGTALCGLIYYLCRSPR